MKTGKQSFTFNTPVYVTAWASTCGKMEAAGPLKGCFDTVVTDPYVGENTWEQAEKKLQQLTLRTLETKAGLQKSEINAVFSGDLLNQCISSSVALNNMSIPHLGLYGACSTMAESLLIASIAVGGGFLENAIAMTSSHFASSERQFRFPLGYGGQRTPTAQRTVTGSGATLLSNKKSKIRIQACTIGTIVDFGVKDANNMGAAMAPAALSTIRAHFRDLNARAEDYDQIITGDLGKVGKELLLCLAEKEGIDIRNRTVDCGEIIFDPKTQDVHSGGSGCGCSAVVLCSSLLNKLQAGDLRKILFCGTGALLSPTSVQQGLSIPAVCHAVSIESVD